MRVLLLQGPVGPFFGHLQSYLENAGIDCCRICFNAGDRHFAGNGKRISFSGSLHEWSNWLRAQLRRGACDVMVGYGCFRPAHAAARALATEFGRPFLSLEEGYLRSGYVTAEYGGNNMASPLAGQLPPPGFTSQSGQSDPNRFHAFARTCRYGAVYYTLRSLLSQNREQALYHRKIRTTREPFLWARNAFRYWRRRAADFQTISHLLEHHDRRYFLGPLQVASHSQMSHAACGWTTDRLISDVLPSFARAAPPSCRLVVKIHPLERGHTDARRTVRASAERLGLAGRVDVLETGSAGLLVRHAAGVITINSTTGFSAIFHGVPLLVVGKALYSHPALASCAHGEPDFDAFWTGGTVADPELRRNYLDWIRHEALLRGDFYAPEGIALACAGILTRLQESPVALRQMIQSAESVPAAASAAAADLALAGLLHKSVA